MGVSQTAVVYSGERQTDSWADVSPFKHRYDHSFCPFLTHARITIYIRVHRSYCLRRANRSTATFLHNQQNRFALRLMRRFRRRSLRATNSFRHYKKIINHQSEIKNLRYCPIYPLPHEITEESEFGGPLWFCRRGVESSG